MKISARALRDDTSFDLELSLIAGEAGLNNEISHPRIQKPGLALAGFVQAVRPHRLQVLGETELSYLATLSAERLQTSVSAYMASGIACIVVTKGLTPPAELLAEADRHKIPVFRSTLASGILITRIQSFLEDHLAAEMTLHAVCIDVFGVGVLLMGQSGIGKSECALDLVLRGHRLVADDTVLVKQRREQVFASGSPVTRYHMEIRGLGIINARDLFGAASVRADKRVELIVHMTEWRKGEAYDRMGIDDATETVLGVAIPKVTIPIRSGRDVASIVEVAARNHLLKLQGHHSARELKEALEQRLTQAARHAPDAERE